MTTHHPLGQFNSAWCERDSTIGVDQALGGKPTDHLADRWTAHVQALGDSSLNDLDVILMEFEDALAVLLERGMVLTRRRHGASLDRVG
jgi:hypothetical protein